MRSRKPHSACRLPLGGFLFLLWMILSAVAIAQPEDEAVVSLGPSGMKVEPTGPDFAVSIPLVIQKGWHINADKVDDEFLIPSTLTFELPAGVQVKKIHYPPAESVKLAVSEKPMKTWKGRIVLNFILTGISDPKAKVTGRFTYQACNDMVCQPPQDLELFTIGGAAPGMPGLPVNSESARPLQEGSPRENLIAGWVDRKGLALALFFIFLSGLALNLTPCVYPMIPITLGFFARKASQGNTHPFFLSFSYFLGLTITYSIVGLTAALTGSLFGNLMQKPVVLIFVAAVIVTLALSMFGLFTIQAPSRLTHLAATSVDRSSGRTGYVQAALMGAMVGLVAAPCIGPVVLALLTFITASGSPFLGFITFFALSCGLGVPYLFLGFFSTKLSKLPKSGGWMIALEHFFGFLLLGVALFLIKPILPSTTTVLLGAGLALFACVWFLLRINKKSSALNAVFGALALGAALWMGLPIFHGAGESGHDALFKPYDRGAIDRAFREGKIVMVDFAADWCIPCKEMEKTTFKNDQVRQRLGAFAVFRADLTRGNDVQVRKLSEEFDIRGVPTMVFLKKGDELKDLRQVGYIEAGDFLKLLEEAQKK